MTSTRSAMPVSQGVMRAADRLRRAALEARGFRSRFVGSRWGRMHALEYEGGGDGPPIVLLHGLSACATDYGPLLLRLRRATRHLVAIDLPGHGRTDPSISDGPSMHAAVREGLDQLVGEPAVLFGTSLGAMMAIRYAAARPNRSLGLVLSSPGGAGMSAPELEALMDQFRIDSHADARAFVDRVFVGLQWARPLLAWGVRVRTARRGVRELVDRIAAEDLLRPEDLRGLTMPVLVLWGPYDRVLPPEHKGFFARHLPASARIEEPAGFGHAPFVERPREVARWIARFARQVAPPSGRTSTRRPSPGP